MATKIPAEERIRLARARLERIHEDALKTVDDVIEVIRKGNTARLAREQALESANGSGNGTHAEPEPETP